MENKYFIFQIFIRPIVDYNIVIYFPRTKFLLKLLEKVQRKFTKRICPCGLTYEQRLVLLSGMSVEKGYKIRTLTIMYRIMFCGLHIDGFNYQLLSSATRGSAYKINIPFCKSNLRKSFPLLRHIALLNSLKPQTSDLSSLSAFRHFLNENVHEAQA